MTQQRRAQAIDAFISLRKAGEELGEDPKVVKGFALGLGIKLLATGTSLNMSRRDYERLKVRIRKVDPDAVTVPSVS